MRPYAAFSTLFCAFILVACGTSESSQGTGNGHLPDVDPPTVSSAAAGNSSDACPQQANGQQANGQQAATALTDQNQQAAVDSCTTVTSVNDNQNPSQSGVIFPDR